MLIYFAEESDVVGLIFCAARRATVENPQVIDQFIECFWIQWYSLLSYILPILAPVVNQISG